MMRKLLLATLLTTQLGAYQDRPLTEVTRTMLTYLEEIQDSSRADHTIWSAFAHPVCNMLVNPVSKQPYTSPPALTLAEQQSLSFLSSYTAQHKTFPTEIHDAVAILTDLYDQPRRGDKYKPRSRSSDVVADRTNQSYLQREHARRASPEERKTARFQHERRVQEKQLKRYERAQKKESIRRHNATHTQSKRRLYLENQQRLAEQQQIWRAKKKQEYEEKLKAEHVRQELERQYTEQENRERERQRLLSGEVK